MLCEVYEKCRSCLLLCIDLNQPSSVIEEASDGYQIRMKCDLDYASYCRARKCLAPIIAEHKLALEWKRDIIIIH